MSLLVNAKHVTHGIWPDLGMSCKCPMLILRQKPLLRWFGLFVSFEPFHSTFIDTYRRYTQKYERNAMHNLFHIPQFLPSSVFGIARTKIIKKDQQRKVLLYIPTYILNTILNVWPPHLCISAPPHHHHHRRCCHKSQAVSGTTQIQRHQATVIDFLRCAVCSQTTPWWVICLFSLYCLLCCLASPLTVSYLFVFAVQNLYVSVARELKIISIIQT